ncbi:MAG: VWA domain-containing protein [Bacteroidota bacterium]
MPVADWTFADPEFLYGLAVLPLLLWWYLKRNRASASDFRFSTLRVFDTAAPTVRERLRHLPFILRMAVLACLVAALARPQSSTRGQTVYAEGIDIALVLDVSGSMLAEDLRPNRIEAAKEVAARFVDGRTSDRIGLVVFAGQSFTQCPLTLDYGVLKGLLREVAPGIIEDGTAIGMAVAQAVNRLRESRSESRVMILLTDGINNRGEIDPLTATQIAQTYGIRIYTIGVGTHGLAPYPVQTPFGTRYRNVPVDVDEKTLREIARMTGARYFRATDNRSLRRIYGEIDGMEKTRVEVRSYTSYEELFYPWALLGLAVLALEWMLSLTLLRKIP